MSFLQGDILEDIALIENLEETKRTAMDIAEKVTQAQDTGVRLSKAREVYRPVAARGALVYFLVDALSALDRVYHYTMATFVTIMLKGMTFFLRPSSQPATFNLSRTWRARLWHRCVQIPDQWLYIPVGIALILLCRNGCNTRW